MKIVVATSEVPFVRGGARVIFGNLVEQLRRRDHEVETVVLPYVFDPSAIVDQMLAVRLLDIRDAGERLITIRAPSHLLRHANKVAWFSHHERAAYDLWGSAYQGLPDSPEGAWTREAIIAGDNAALREMTHVYANSHVVADRLRRYNGIEAEVLYPPLGADSFQCAAYGDFIFCPSRLTRIKRQDLLIEAMSHAKTDVRLVLAGNPDLDGEIERLESIIERLALQDRVDLRVGWIDDDEKRELFANALACAYVPYDEESYGFVTLESCEAQKAIVTCIDSGGVLELVEDGKSGRVVSPKPEALAAAFDELRADTTRARELGIGAQSRVAELPISWDHVVDRLLA